MIIMFGFKRKPPTPEQLATIETKDFFDCIADRKSVV